MSKFFCNGKNDICDCDILCADCNFFDNSGGDYVEQPMTNADRIRAMTDEELAMMVPCPGDGNCDNKDRWDCKECCLNWLKQPVKGDAE